MRVVFLTLLVSLPALAEISFSPGMKMSKEGNHEGAARFYESICDDASLNSENRGRCFNNLANEYIQLKKYDQALSAANRAIALGAGTGYLHLGQVQMNRDRKYKLAIANIQRGGGQSALNFYSISNDVKSCFNRGDQGACLKSCATKAGKNTVARNEACRRGRRHFGDQCTKGNIASCQRACDQRRDTEGWGLVGAFMSNLSYCSRATTLIRERANRRTAKCTGERNKSQCKLACNDDKRAAACTVLREIEEGERAARRAQCEDGDVASCTASCQQDKDADSCERERVLFEAQRATWSKGCKAQDASSCLALGRAFRDGTSGAPKDPAAAGELMLSGCKLDDAASCVDLERLEVPRYTRALRELKCARGERPKCRAFAEDLIAGTGGPKDIARGGKLLDEGCQKNPPDVESCRAIGRAFKDSDDARAVRALERACDSKDANSCVELVERLAVVSGPTRDAGRATDVRNALCEWERAACNRASAAMRRGDIYVPGDARPPLFDGHINGSVLLGLNTNPYRTSAQLQGQEGDTLFFDTRGVLRVGLDAEIGKQLGPLAPKAGVLVDVSAFTAGESDTPNLLNGDVEGFFSLGLAAGPAALKARVSPNVSLTPGLSLDLATLNAGAHHRRFRVPISGAAPGDQSGRYSLEADASARLSFDESGIDVGYQFISDRVFAGPVAGDFAELGALFDPSRFTKQGAFPPAAAAAFDRTRHRGHAKLEFFVEDFDFVTEDALIYVTGALAVDTFGGDERTPLDVRIGMTGVEDDERWFDLELGLATTGAFSDATLVGRLSFIPQADVLRGIVFSIDRDVRVHPLAPQLISNRVILRTPLSDDDEFPVVVDSALGFHELPQGETNGALGTGADDTDGYLELAAGLELRYPISVVDVLFRADLTWWTADRVLVGQPTRASAGAPIDHAAARALIGVAF